MKSILTISLLSILNVNFNILPSGALMVCIGFVVLLDLVTGVIKAIIKGDARTSFGYTRTLKKGTQYLGAISISTVLKYLYSLPNKENTQAYLPFMNYFHNGLLLYIIYIEVYSIFENLNEIDRKSPFARFIIRPMLSIMGFSIKNNFISQQAEKLESKNTRL